MRGAARDRHETRGGMRWTRSLRETNARGRADGEAVWSWRRDAGVKFLRCVNPIAVHRGEHAISRKPLRREGRIASAEPVCSCAFLLCLLRTRPRVQRAPGFPCTLLFLQRVAIDAKLGRIAPRQCGR